jgi:transmembrane serine protease 9
MCLNIKQCPSLLNLLRQQLDIAGVADFLRASACGYEGRDPKVCCPSVATGTTGPPPENNTRAPVTEYVRLPDLSECGIVGPGVEDRRIVGGYPAELGKCVQVCGWVLSDRR